MFGVPVIAEQVGLVLAVQEVPNRALRIVDGFRFGFAASINATTPDTCGVAIDVPLAVAYPQFNHVE